MPETPREKSFMSERVRHVTRSLFYAQSNRWEKESQTHITRRPGEASSKDAGRRTMKLNNDVLKALK